MLLAFGHPVATCYDHDMLRVENRTSAHAQAQHCCIWQTTTTPYNIHKGCMKNLTIFKFDPTTPNVSRHVATRCNRVAKRTQHVAPNNVAIYCVEMLRSFGRNLQMLGKQCWDMLRRDVVIVWPGLYIVILLGTKCCVRLATTLRRVTCCVLLAQS